jgi:hypothetical protein
MKGQVLLWIREAAIKECVNVDVVYLLVTCHTYNQLSLIEVNAAQLIFIHFNKLCAFHFNLSFLKIEIFESIISGLKIKCSSSPHRNIFIVRNDLSLSYADSAIVPAIVGYHYYVTLILLIRLVHHS